MLRVPQMANDACLRNEPMLWEEMQVKQHVVGNNRELVSRH